MGAVLTYISTVITSFWNAVLQVVSAVLQFFADIVMAVIGFLMDAFVFLLSFAFSWLPAVPPLPGGPAGGTLAATGLANYFFPLSEFLQALVFLAAVYGAVWLYKGGKFFRGGG